ncbi:class I adenylate cyclase [Pleionea sediminis]|uniref:class I adenylate cyclase n=1 Tax=Pleionea sediminis TaxID=2569479 RepID=UPI001186A26B|nr:class I adenylate cyclase [Pleionea sediminis]
MGQNSSSDSMANLEIDKKRLKQLQHRFLELNDQRKSLLEQNLNERESNFLELIPFLFHINHPTLPGYVGSQTPCGVANYEVSRATLQLAKKYARSLDYSPRAVRQIQIDAIYLMGSAGSIAHSSHSDLDIWVCCRKELNQEQRQLLRDKRDAIHKWAKNQSIDTSIYLVDENDILDSSAENEQQTIKSGLLLDEFYRTQIHLAGRYLLWWLVPPEQRADYAKFASKLIDERHVQRDEWIDFGPVKHIEIEEFLSNALWYINKALESPYKTALKLVLMESYLSQYPNVQPLSNDYKQFVYDLMDNATVVDSYLLMHRKVEEYLILNNQTDRLEFVRRCLYQKINERVIKQGNQLKETRKIIENLVDEWHWNVQKRKLFDNKANWDINQIGNEKRLYIKQLITSFRTIGQFIKQHELFYKKYKMQLLTLSRKISANLELTQGKIERVNINFVPQMVDKHLSLVRQTKARDLELWSFYDRAISHQETYSAEPVYQCGSLLELLVWAKVNGLLSEGTAVQYRDSKQQLQYDELEHLIQELLANDYSKKKVGDEVYQSPPVVNEISCFINVAQDKLTNIAKQGMHIITNKNDPFCYGTDCYNLIETIDLYYVNSWGEQFVIHFKGDTSLSEAAIALLELIERQDKEPLLKFFNFSSMRSAEIINRVKGLYRQLISCYQEKQGAITKYVFRLGIKYCVVEKQGERFVVHQFNDEEKLSELLINQFNDYQLIQLDPRCFTDPVIQIALYKSSRGSHTLIVNPHIGYKNSYCFIDQHGGLVYGFFSHHDIHENVNELFKCLKNSCHDYDPDLTYIHTLNKDQSLSRYEKVNQGESSSLGLTITVESKDDSSESEKQHLIVQAKGKEFRFDRRAPDLSLQFKRWLDRAFEASFDDIYIEKLNLHIPQELLTEAKVLLERNTIFRELTEQSQ